MKEKSTAVIFAALGNETRLAVLRLLVRAGDKGLNVMAIRDALNIPASTLTHHILMLVQAGVVIQEKRGRELISRADFGRIQKAITFLMEDCCRGVIAVDQKRTG